MDRRALQNWTKHELALRAAEMVLSTLEKNGVRALAVKGLLLARQVYDTKDRAIADVDLIISSSDFDVALHTARAAGWSLVWDSKVWRNVNFVVEGTAFDVKTSIGPAGFSAIGVADVFARAVLTRQPLGFFHWQIEQHDHALLLAVDAFKDKLGAGKPWAREDLVRIAEREGFSPSTLVERASAARLQTMLAIVADWVLSSAPSPAWSEIRKHLGGVSIRTRYADRYKDLLGARPTSTWARWHLAIKTRAVSDSAGRRGLALMLGALGTVRYVVRHGLRADPWGVHRGSSPR